jgi:hypothetical protein
MICPKCDGELDAYIKAKWGDGIQKESIVPFICSLCASILFFDQRTGTLMSPEQIDLKTGLDSIGLLTENQTLWSAISANRKLILSAPNRRPVLR